MKVEFRKRQEGKNNLRKLTKVDVNNQELGEEPIYVRFEEAENNVIHDGTALIEADFENINWKDDGELVFSNNHDTLPKRLENKTQIVGLTSGQVWVVPPIGGEEDFQINKLIQSELYHHYGYVRITDNGSIELSSEQGAMIHVGSSVSIPDNLPDFNTWLQIK